MTPTDEPVIHTQMLKDHVALVTLNRPHARNAVSVALAETMSQTVQQLEADDNVWAVILTGAGDVFCAGADLKVVAAGEGNALFRPWGGFAGFVDAPRQKPWIAALNGPALAGGCEIMLACDMVVAAEGARIGLPEVARSLLAAAGGLIRLPRALPRNIAIEVAITAEPIGAQRAHELGLVNRVVPGPRLLEEALALAERVTRNAPLAVRESLQIVKHSASGWDEAALRDAVWAARECISATADFQEGPRAFIEKRLPQWKGH